jgi:hypothetical protein
MSLNSPIQKCPIDRLSSPCTMIDVSGSISLHLGPRSSSKLLSHPRAPILDASHTAAWCYLLLPLHCDVVSCGARICQFLGKCTSTIPAQVCFVVLQILVVHITLSRRRQRIVIYTGEP